MLNALVTSLVVGAADGGAPAAVSLRAMSGASQAPHAASARASRTSACNWVPEEQTPAPEVGQMDRDDLEAALADPGLLQGSGDRSPPSARRAGDDTAAPRVPREQTRTSEEPNPQILAATRGDGTGGGTADKADAASGGRAVCARAWEAFSRAREATGSPEASRNDN